MKRTFAFYTLMLSVVSTAPAWAHPGHGAPGLWHHAADLGLWALLAVAVVAVSVAITRHRSKR
jgi:hypothetical protein